MIQIKLTRISNVLLPLSFLAASLLRREYAALLLYIGVLSSEMCALATANGLRATFARQPSMRCVQGSTLIALGLQPVGGFIAALLLYDHIPLSFFIAGTLLNIEHVFYEYLYAVGDEGSATLCHILAAILNLAGLLLAFPPTMKMTLPAACEPGWLMATNLIAALVALIIGKAMGGAVKPKLTAEALRAAPLSLLQTAFYPTLALVALYMIRPYVRTVPPLFVGLSLYELFRTPFRRTPAEAASMNRLLLLCCAGAGTCILYCLFASPGRAPSRLSMACAAIILAALCLFVLFGNLRRREKK